MIDFKDQYFGVEIELTAITREQAARAVAQLFQTRAVYLGGGYEKWCVSDREGKQWHFVFDNSIHAVQRSGGRYLPAGGQYKVEMVSPKLEYSEMGKLQEVIRAMRRRGGRVGPSMGMHVHVDAKNHTAGSLKNALTIMYSKEDILFQALKVNSHREQEYCQKVRENVLRAFRRMPSDAPYDILKRLWYEGGDESNTHYSDTRYYAMNLHSVFQKGTLEWRCFESTLHAGKARANITLALMISAMAINQRSTQMKKTVIHDNPCFTFRTFLLRLGMIGPEFKNVRKHLLANLDGDKAWRYDKSNYTCLNKPKEQDAER